MYVYSLCIYACAKATYNVSKGVTFFVLPSSNQKIIIFCHNFQIFGKNAKRWQVYVTALWRRHMFSDLLPHYETLWVKCSFHMDFNLLVNHDRYKNYRIHKPLLMWHAGQSGSVASKDKHTKLCSGLHPAVPQKLRSYCVIKNTLKRQCNTRTHSHRMTPPLANCLHLILTDLGRNECL